MDVLTQPLARFTCSRKDPSAPPGELVILDAQLEIFVESAIMVELIVFSFVLVEKLRRDTSGEVAIGLQDASSRVTVRY
jgi:hypothetical protein